MPDLARSARTLVFLGALVAMMVPALLVPGCGGGRATGFETETGGGGEITAEARARHDELVATGEAAWAERDNADRLRACIDAWTQAVEAVPTDWELWQRLARAQYFLADGHMSFDPALEAETTAQYQTAITSAERSLAEHYPEFGTRMRDAVTIEEKTAAFALVDTSGVPALYWRASALGRWARRDGFATVLSYKDEIRAMMTQCLNVDRYYFYAGPDRYFGAFYSVAPTYAGGDLDLSRQHFEHSIGVAPNYFGTHVLFALEYAVKAQNRDLFTSELNLVINGDPNVEPDIRPENLAEIHKATDGLARIDELFE